MLLDAQSLLCIDCVTELLLSSPFTCSWNNSIEVYLELVTLWVLKTPVLMNCLGKHRGSKVTPRAHLPTPAPLAAANVVAAQTPSFRPTQKEAGLKVRGLGYQSQQLHSLRFVTLPLRASMSLSAQGQS